MFHPKMCVFYIHINTVERMMTTSINSSWSYNNNGVSQILDPPLCMFYESMSSLFLISTLRTYTVLVESDAAKGTAVDDLASVILLRCSVDTTGERQFGDVELVL